MIAKPVTFDNLKAFQSFLAQFKDHADTCYEGCEWVRDADKGGFGQSVVGEHCDAGHTLLERWLRVP